MDNIDLFDKYIKGELSEEERQKFDTRMKTDKSFADDFKVYSAIVIGICKEAEQDNKDFEMAMKNISKEQLRETIGKKNESKEKSPQAASEVIKAIKPNFVRTWMWQAACWAVIIGGAAIWIMRADQNARYSVDNAIYTSSYVYEGQSRGAINIPDLNSLSDTELKEKIPTFVTQFNECDITADIYEVGYSLAMAYMRLHEREKAKKILNQMINKLSVDEDYTEEVSKLKSILNILK